MTFSVIIPVHNRAGTILNAVNSVLKQAFTDFEIIVVDDGSTDQTAHVLKDIHDIRFRYVYQQNKERSAARNFGVSLSSGKYVTFLDSDDEALPDWLSHYRGLFDAEDAALVCGGYLRTNKRNASNEAAVFPQNLGPFFHNRKCLFWPAGAFAVRRDLFNRVGGYVEHLTYSENTELGLRLVEACVKQKKKIASIAAPLIRYHKPPSEKRINPGAILTSMRYFLERHSDALHRDPNVHGLYLSMAGVNAARLGEYAEARKYFRKAVILHPYKFKHILQFMLLFFPSAARKFWLRHG